jgi:hypothetical protein
LIRRDNTFAIRELKVGVQAQAVPDPTGRMEPLRDEVAEAFAQQLTRNYDRLSRAYPELGRVAVMFRLAALAYGMRSLHDSPDLRYWLDEYDVPPVLTATEYPVLHRTEMVDVEGETLTVHLEGGIEMEEGTLRLEDGDLSVLSEAVLRSRPDPGALIWRVALSGAWFESDATPEESDDSTGERRRGAGVAGGTYLTRRVAAVPGPAHDPSWASRTSPAACPPIVDAQRSARSWAVRGIVTSRTASTLRSGCAPATCLPQTSPRAV